MDMQDYERLKAEYDTYRQKAKKAVDRHYGDRDLFHPVGGDPYCLYCEEYNNYSEKMAEIADKIQTFEQENFVDDPMVEMVQDKPRRGGRKYRVYQVRFKDGEEYLIYGFRIESSLYLLRRKKEDLENYVIIPERMYDTLYLESLHRAVLKLSDIVETQKGNGIKVLAKRDTSRLRILGECYNKTPFEYIRYDLHQYKRLLAFCGNCEVTKTKKFKSKGRVSVAYNRGTFGIEYGQVLVRFGEDIYMVLTQEEFEEHFALDEPLSWVEED